MRTVVFFLLVFGSIGAYASTAKEELQCLAMNVYHEARGEPVEGQVAVALVTMNRVAAKNYPNTVCKVVWQRRQFSWTHDGRSDRPNDKKSWEQARKIANFVYNKYTSLKSMSAGAIDITKGALHYYAPKHADPYWADYKEITREIGGHVFLRAKKHKS
ncbi:MAG: cell wall hydrolase [Gammaproteobacteria bacterium]|nr:cell wall hydrolase [Gammaproteobacteria bacterium]MDH5728732.1 cell wall hydrolase [Gammaproteobacteria bacterium]